MTLKPYIFRTHTHPCTISTSLCCAYACVICLQTELANSLRKCPVSMRPPVCVIVFSLVSLQETDEERPECRTDRDLGQHHGFFGQRYYKYDDTECE